MIDLFFVCANCGILSQEDAPTKRAGFWKEDYPEPGLYGTFNIAPLSSNSWGEVRLPGRCFFPHQQECNLRSSGWFSDQQV